MRPSASNITNLLRARLLAVGVLAGALASPLWAQSGGGFDLTKSIVAGGGGTSSGGVFEVNCTVGQLNAGRTSGGLFVLNSGFWAGLSLPTTGACCDGGCTDGVDQAACQASGGTYQGDGTDCATSPCPSQCPADLNGDLDINAPDLAIVLGNWGTCPSPCTPGLPGTTCLGDLDGDCDVNAMDLAIMLGCWAQPCPCP